MIPDAVLTWKELAEMARVFSFEPAFLLAVIWKESAGNKWAWNPEPPYRYLWDVRYNRRFRKLTPAEGASEVPPADFHSVNDALVARDAEFWGQQSSWGLMQPMGAVARERGFKGLFLNELHEPAINVQIGCLHLQKYFIATGNIREALRCYNGGPANTDYIYADDVLKKYAEVKRAL